MEEQIRTLGPYKLIRKIGRGTFGVVWLAEKRTSIATSQFALKLPRDEEIDLEAFKQEAAIWVQASGHPNVLPMIEAEIYDERVVIVSEYVPDGSLAAWLNEHGSQTPPVEAVCEMIDGVLAGLAHLHKRLIVHRDLKPDNILLQGNTPRLTDFGISRLLRSGSYSTNVSGTLAYMAPEAFDGKRNERTDIWAIGVIFYQLLAGRLPFDQTDATSLVGAITRYDPPPLADSVPSVLREIVMKALRRDPSQRYASAAEMRRDLREAEHRLWLGGQKADIEPAAVVPPTTISEPAVLETLPVAPKPTWLSAISTQQDLIVSPTIPVGGKSRHRLWITGLVGSVLLVIFAVGIYRWALPDNSRQTPQAAATQQSLPSVNINQASTPETAKRPQRPYVLKRTLTGHSDYIWSVIFSPDGKTLASASQDGVIKLWDAQNGALKKNLTSYTDSVYSIAFSPDGKTLASGDGFGKVKLLDVQTGALQLALAGHNGMVTSIIYSPDGRTLATGSYDQTVKLWDVGTGALKRTLAGHSDVIYEIALSPDGGTLASESRDKTLKLWEVETGALKQTLNNNSWDFSVVFSPDGKTLASGSNDGKVKLLDAQTGVLKQILKGHTDNAKVVVFSPDGGTLASGSYDKTVKLWDVQTGVLRQTLKGHGEYVNSVAFSPDGNRLASAGSDKTVKLWQVQ